MSGLRRFHNPFMGESLLLSPQGTASRRQWWLGHLWALVFTGAGFLGGVGVLTSLAVQFGLDCGGIPVRMLVLATILLCLLQFAGASNALSRRRLNARGEAHDLADAALGLTALAMVLLVYDGATRLLLGELALPHLPHWLTVIAAASSALGLAALALECGVLERSSLTELWRGRRPHGIAGVSPVLDRRR